MSSGPLSHPQRVKQGHVPFLNFNRMRTFSPRSEGERRPPSFPAFSVPLPSSEGLNTILSLAHSWCLSGPSQEHSTGVFLSSSRPQYLSPQPSSAVRISLLFPHTRKTLFLRPCSARAAWHWHRGGHHQPSLPSTLDVEGSVGLKLPK